MKIKNHVLMITVIVLLLPAAGSSVFASDEQGSLSKITFYVA